MARRARIPSEVLRSRHHHSSDARYLAVSVLLQEQIHTVLTLPDETVERVLDASAPRVASAGCVLNH